MSKEFNWAGNYEYSTDKIYYPKTIEEIQQIVKKCDKVKVLGTRHSFNGIADSTENLISLKEISPAIAIDAASRSVTVGAGIRYGQLCGQLQRAGLALHNLGSLPHISIAGACVSATHGSGVKNAILATAVSAMEIIKADGELIMISRAKDGEKFNGAMVNLGALGVVTKLTLDLQPSFDVKQDVYENLPLKALENNFHDILSLGYSVSLFTDWKTNSINQVWIKSKLQHGAAATRLLNDLFGATAATTNLHPIPGMAVENCTEQMGVPGPWHERLPHFRMDFTPSSGEELQSEYFVPLNNAFESIEVINSIRDHISPYLLISELRTIDADNLWMSPCYKQPSLAIHFTWRQNWEAVRKVLPLIEEKLAPFSGRPHWGKLFTMEPSRLQSLYAKLPAFKQLITEYDPAGKFRNAYLAKYIFGS